MERDRDRLSFFEDNFDFDIIFPSLTVGKKEKCYNPIKKGVVVFMIFVLKFSNSLFLPYCG